MLNYSSQDIQEMLLCLRFNQKNCVLKITIWRRNSIECFLYSLWFVASYVSNWRQKLMGLGETTSLVIRYRVYSWLKGPPPQCHAFPIFSFLFQKKTNKPHRKTYHAEFSEYAKFHKNPLEAHENMGPPSLPFLQRSTCHRASACPVTCIFL